MRYPDELQEFAGDIPNHHRVIDISINTSIGPSCTCGLSDLPIMMTGEVGLPDAVELMSMPRP